MTRLCHWRTATAGPPPGASPRFSDATPAGRLRPEVAEHALGLQDDRLIRGDAARSAVVLAGVDGAGEGSAALPSAAEGRREDGRDLGGASDPAFGRDDLAEGWRQRQGG